MNKSFPKIRLIIVSLLFINWIIFGFNIITEEKYLPIFKFIFSYSVAFLYFIASILLICRKKITDIISFIIFTICIFSLVSSSIAYCKQQNLITISSCSQSVFSVLSNHDWAENSFYILATITILYLSINLLKSLFKKKELLLK
jgi:hypothetical protein